MCDKCSNCKSDKPGNTTKYFFITAQATKMNKLKDILGSNDEEEDIEDALNALNMDAPDKSNIPVMLHYSMVLESPTGMFIPSYIENFVKESTKADNVCITFVREMSLEEYTANKMYKATIDKKGDIKELTYNVKQELEDIIGRTESGDIRIIKPEEPDVPLTDEQKQLKDLGLPTNLFDDTGLWEDEE